MAASQYRIGCNVIDPLLKVGPGTDYTLPVGRRSLEFLAELGFDAVEFSHALHWTDEELQVVRKMTEEIGIGVWSIHAWAAGDVLQEEHAEKASQILNRAAEVALALGAGRVVHHPSGGSLEGDGMQRLACEVDLIRAAHRPGFLFALENMSSMAQVDYLVTLVDRLGPQVAGICVDTGHANLGADLGAPTALRRAGHRLITTHLQDNHGTRDEHLPPGDGLIDWDEVALALRETGYEGCLMLELTDHPGDARAPHLREEIARGAAMARKLWEMTRL